MNEHLFKPFDEELNKLRYRLVRLGTLVQQQIELAVNALVENNPELAKLVLDIEQKVDKLDIKIDKQCLRIFALHQPVAMDLRLVLSAVSINDNMEMTGDLATNIANNYLEMKYYPGIVAKTKLPALGKEVIAIITKVLDSFVNMEKEPALEAIQLEKTISALYKENFRIISGLMKVDSELIDTCAHLLDVNRNLQTIYKQVKSVAEELIFLQEAKLIKHNYSDDVFNFDDDLNSNE